MGSVARHGEAVSSVSRAGLQGLQRDLEELGLNGSEARVVVALLQVQQATGTELARLSGVPRTAVYPVLDQLRTKGVIHSVVGRATLWASPGPDAILERLYALQQQRLEALEATRERARRAVAEMALDEPSASFPSLHVLRGLAQLSDLYLRLLGQARSEVLVCNRGPYGRVAVAPEVIDMLARNVSARALYEARDLDDPEQEAFREVVEAYHRAGVEGRVVDRLPLAYAVFDRTDVLFSLDDPELPLTVSSVPVHICHAGFAAAQADMFEHYWSAATPYPGPAPGHRVDRAEVEVLAVTEPAEA